MKWHKNIYYGIIEILSKIIEREEKAEKALHAVFREKRQWGKRDREQVTNVVYEILRKYNLYHMLALKFFQGNPLPEALLKVYVCLHSVPPSFDFIPDETCRFLRDYAEKLQENPVFRLGLPEWIHREGKESRKENWETMALALNEPSNPVLRINTLRTNPETFKNLLREKGYLFRETEIPEAIVLEKNYRLTNTPWYRQGFFEFQDLSSQKAGKFIQAKPGMKVMDACAGAGGKTLQLAAEMKNKGMLYAMDIAPGKLDILQKRARRAGVKILKEISLPREKLLKKLENTFDLVVADAPCSGSGTYRRKPDLKWRFSKELFDKIRIVQKEILDAYAGLVKPGGHLIYITCSVLDKENREQIKNFLNRNKNFSFVEDQYLLPGKEKFDGFYMARLKKKI